MKISFIFFCVLLLTLNCFSQNSFKCPCSKIGIDNLWADSNKVSCYLIPVAKNISNPAAGTFKLAVLVAASLTKTNEDPLLYLHGGPGIATIENVPRYLRSKTWKVLREKRGVVFLDYRGTGSSEPKLCPDLKDSLDNFSKTNSSAASIQSYKISLYKKCERQLLKSGTTVSSFNSVQLAEDANSIRKALGINKWGVYGVSYGTTVALNLLRMHEKALNCMILDSPFPPNAPWLDFIRPFDTCFKILEKNISADPVLYAQFRATRSDFVQAVKRLNKTPFKIKDATHPEGYDFSGDDFAWSIWSAMLNPKSIPFVPLAIREAGNGNYSILSKWVVAFNDPNSFGKFSEPQSKAILCFESKPRGRYDTKASLLENYPDFSSLYVDFEGSLCDAWQPGSAGKKTFEPVKSNLPVLILSGEYDPVCPPVFGELTARSLPASTFIIVPSASHAAIHADDCLRNIANNFLLSPGAKLNIDCVRERPKIKFVLENLSGALLQFR